MLVSARLWFPEEGITLDEVLRFRGACTAKKVFWFLGANAFSAKHIEVPPTVLMYWITWTTVVRSLVIGHISTHIYT
jgi:hypothetical protein